jgi:hypothetical protein
VWILLAACQRPASDDTAPDLRDDTAAGVVCPSADAPALATDVWAKSGAVPAMGLHTFASDGGAPIWAASHSTGVWRAGEDLVWDDVVLGITHTVSEIALRPEDPDHAFRSAGGALERTRDGGATWTPLPLGLMREGEPTPSEVWAVAVAPWSSDRVLAVQENGAASVSEDDGETWTTVGYAPVHEPPAVDDPFQVWGWRLLPELEAGGRTILGDGFGVAVSDDGLRTWLRTLDTPLGGYSLVRDPLDPDHLLVGGPDALYESVDAGSTWTSRDLGGDILVGAWAGDGSWLTFVGSGSVYVSADGGETFATRGHPIHQPSGAIILDDGRLLIASHSGAWVSADRGLNWVDISTGLEDRGMSVVLADPACPARVYAGSRCGGGLFVSDDYGGTWAPVHTYFHYVMGLQFDPTVQDRLWAVSDDRLLRSDDRGASWSESWRKYHFHGFTVHPDDPDVLLIGSVGSGEWADATMRVYRSDDGGGAWVDSSGGLPASDASAHAMVRWPGAPDVVLLGTYKGGDVSHQTGSGVGLYRSTDGGATWALAPAAVTDVAALAATSDRVFAATDQGIWRSADQGATWEQAPGPTDAALAVGFGGDVGLALMQNGDLWMSRDAGETWERHDNGLARNTTTELAQVAVSADGAVGYVTVFDEGVWRIGLRTD